MPSSHSSNSTSHHPAQCSPDGHLFCGLDRDRTKKSLSERLESITAGTIQDLTLTHDAVGNLLSRSDGVMGWTEGFTYDALNRITGVSGPANKTYAYDAIGNITNKSDVGACAYNDPNHVHAVT